MSTLTAALSALWPLNMCGWLLMKMKKMMMTTTTIRWECASCKSSKEADRKSTEKGETAEWPKVIAESPVKFCGDLGEAEEMWGPCMLSKPKIDQHPNGRTFFCWTSWIFSCCSHRQKSRRIPWALRFFFFFRLLVGLAKSTNLKNRLWP